MVWVVVGCGVEAGCRVCGAGLGGSAPEVAFGKVLEEREEGVGSLRSHAQSATVQLAILSPLTPTPIILTSVNPKPETRGALPCRLRASTPDPKP